MAESLAWGIVGTGMIARQFAKGVQHSRTGRLVAVGSRRSASADTFGEEYDIPNRHGSYESLLADDTVEAVYISTPHPMHAEWAVKAAEAGKHILCEKPLTLNHAEAMAVVEAARQHDVFLMEAFMYRCHPQTARMLELLREGVIGEVRVIQACFSFNAQVEPSHRLLSNELGGGGILDVGCYAVSFARMVAGVATDKAFVEPVDVKGVARLGETGVDAYALAVLKFPGDVIANVATGVQVHQENVARIFGSEGHMFIPEPWTPYREGGTGKLIIKRDDAEQSRVEEITDARWLYAIEADTVAEHLDARQAASPAMTWDDTLGNMKTLDRWRESIGLIYSAERNDSNITTITRRPLTFRESPPMSYLTLPGIDRPASRIVMGVDNQFSLAHASVMFDDYVARGGNVFDTARIYGPCEDVLGQWIRNRSIREEIVLITKGAHTPYCTPEDMNRELRASLEHLGVDSIDLYLLHRDNPDVPVGEFVESLNAHLRAGRIRGYGGSNWSLDRVREAQLYAQANKLVPMQVVSNQFSLARMVEPPWPGCLSAGTPEFRAWLEESQTPLLAWSSQARGFFAGDSSPQDRSDAERVRCWYADDNFARLDRARFLAQRKNVLPINVALAYVLRQSFPTLALIGPRTLEETRIAWKAVDVVLTEEELLWLESGKGAV